MKLTKKILSLVLAAALVLGSIAVAANAADYDGLAYEGSKLTYTITSNKTDESGVTNVKIGESIEIYVYMQNNYYIGASGGEFFLWTSGIFNTLANTDVVASGIVAKTFNITPNNPAATGMYPSTHGTADWVGYYSSRNANAGTVPEIISDPQLIYTITLTVPEDTSLVGKTAVFEMPAGSIKSVSQSGRKGAIYQSIASTATNAAESIAYPETVDVSGAKLTMNIVTNVATEYCDYTVLETAYAKTPAYSAEYYDTTAYTTWSKASAAAANILNADKLVKTDANQAIIDNAADALEDAYAALVPAFVDLTKLNNTVEACDEIDPAEVEYYDADLYAAWQAALAEAQAAQTSYATAPATQQAEVDAIADSLKAAYDALEATYVDLTKLNNTVDACNTPEYDKSVYNADLYATWESALAEAQAAQTTYATAPATQQATVDGIADALQAAYDALVPNVVDLSDLEKAVEESVPEYSAEYYDADEYAAYEAAMTAATAGLTDYAGAADTAANQEAVAKLASDLRDAYAALDARFVDLTPIEEALAECVPAYSEEYYDAAAWANYEAAVAVATTIFDGYKTMADTQEYRGDVAEAAQAIRDAYAALVPAFVSYEKVEKAIADYSTTEHPEFYYTADSWAAYADALAAANEANTNRPDPLPAATEANQAAVDAYATALEEAYNALTPAGDCSIISVTPLQETFDVNDVINFEVLCEGSNYTKIRLIRANGATSTYDRANAAVKSITVNEDGNEVWVISRKIYDKEYTEYAKAKVGKVWDEGVCPYDVKCAGKDSTVKSAVVTLNDEVVTDALRTDVLTITVVTGPAATKVRLLDPVTGGTLTLSSPISVNDDGTKVWVLVRQFSTVKDYDYDVYSKSPDNVWSDSGIDLEFTINAVPVSQLPSTGDAADAIYEDESGVAYKRIFKGNTQVFTVVTDKDAKSVKITSENGTVIKFTNVVSVDEANGTKTWVCERKCSVLGDYSYTVEALYGSTWIAGDSTLDFTVIY